MLGSSRKQGPVRIMGGGQQRMLGCPKGGCWDLEGRGREIPKGRGSIRGPRGRIGEWAKCSQDTHQARKANACLPEMQGKYTRGRVACQGPPDRTWLWDGTGVLE